MPPTFPFVRTCTYCTLNITPRTGEFEKSARAATDSRFNVQPCARSMELWTTTLLRDIVRILFRWNRNAHLTPIVIGLSIVHRSSTPIKAKVTGKDVENLRFVCSHTSQLPLSSQYPAWSLYLAHQCAPEAILLDAACLRLHLRDKVIMSALQTCVNRQFSLIASLKDFLGNRLCPIDGPGNGHELGNRVHTVHGSRSRLDDSFMRSIQDSHRYVSAGMFEYRLRLQSLFSALSSISVQMSSSAFT